ncbi:MAG: Holliday junction branch migration protein RuvA [Anaerolineae bacterium]|nr:Holliday junction branch migration protein RuvA [Anaerolineae bacterium]
MIARLQGVLVARGKDHVIVGVGGVGFAVRVPAPLLASAPIGEAIVLFTHLQVRADDLTLFGFQKEEELRLFELLLTVPGVGPRTALAVLSAMSPDALRLAVGQEQADLLGRVPGIGPKTAKKIVFDLKDKIGPVAGMPEGLAALTSADAEVIDALTALGYSIIEAQRAVQSVPREVEGVEERLRRALAYFV